MIGEPQRLHPRIPADTVTPAYPCGVYRIHIPYTPVSQLFRPRLCQISLQILLSSSTFERRVLKPTTTTTTTTAPQANPTRIPKKKTGFSLPTTTTTYLVSSFQGNKIVQQQRRETANNNNVVCFCDDICGGTHCYTSTCLGQKNRIELHQVIAVSGSHSVFSRTPLVEYSTYRRSYCGMHGITISSPSRESRGRETKFARRLVLPQNKKKWRAFPTPIYLLIGLVQVSVKYCWWAFLISLFFIPFLYSVLFYFVHKLR